MPQIISIGEGSFRVLRESGAEYVDKTRLIEQWLDDKSRVLLLPRPRRFGKTLNLTMLYEFVARQEAASEHLFEGLHIKTVWEQYRYHFRRYPTIYITLKNIRPSNIDGWYGAIRSLLANLTKNFNAIKASLNREEQLEFELLQTKRADVVLMTESLQALSRWLERAYGEKVMILIDEFDTPIQDAWLMTEQALLSSQKKSPGVLLDGERTLYSEVVDFFRTFFGSALKDNPHLARSVVTGILRVSNENIFSELNNLDVKTVLHEQYADAFGFTEPEMEALFERQEQQERLAVARIWYNGYRFGNQVMYNPWSVTNFLRDRSLPPEAYWLNTSGNNLIKHLLSEHALDYYEDIQALMDGREVVMPLRTNLSLFQIRQSKSALFNLLLFAGYLKVRLRSVDDEGRSEYAFSIPNLEVGIVYAETFETWLESQLHGRGVGVKRLADALLSGDEDTLETMLEDLALNLLSIHDQAARRPEALYQGLMLGLCGGMSGHYQVLSNREAGYGRADMLIVPRKAGRAGAVLKLKVAKRGKQTLLGALKEGETQLRTRRDASVLEASGAHPIQS